MEAKDAGESLVAIRFENFIVLWVVFQNVIRKFEHQFSPYMFRSIYMDWICTGDSRSAIRGVFDMILPKAPTASWSSLVSVQNLARNGDL